MTLANPLLSLTCHRVITRFGEHGRIRGAAFNKLMTLLNRRLLHERTEQRLDIGLPHCWYLFGDEVVPWELPQEVRFEPQQAPVQKTVFRWEGMGVSLQEPHEWAAKRVGEEVDRLEREFGNPVDLTAIVDEVYDGAPFPFQVAFLKFRRRLVDRSDYWKFEQPVEGILLPLFDLAMDQFPYRDFPELITLAHQYKRLTRYALELKLHALDYAASFTEEFWQAYCYFLRIHPQGHQNVSESRLINWKRTAYEFLPSVGPKLTAAAGELVTNLDPTIDPLDRAALIGSDWGKGSERASEEVHSIVYQ